MFPSNRAKNVCTTFGYDDMDSALNFVEKQFLVKVHFIQNNSFESSGQAYELKF